MAPPLMGSPSKAAPDGAARLVLDRVRKTLTAHADGVRLDPVRLIQILSTARPPAAREAERSFTLGWLHWLRGDFAAAEPALAEAIRLARRQEGAAPPAEAAYWLGRVRVLLGRPDAVSEYETVLRETRGEARAVAWLVDLLWRAGRVDRAEQVWKSVRANKKVAACDEGPLLEARALLRRGETAAAERLLNESAPGGGVVRAERRLLLAWTLTSLKQYDRAKEQFDRAREGPYPAAALECWRILLEKRRAGRIASPDEAGRPPALAPLLRGYEALREGETERAVAAMREAAAAPAAPAFARYALARLGRDDPAAVLASQPGLFLALRCRALVALDRFRKREAPPAELLDALRQATSAGWTDPAADHFRRLALALQLQRPTIDDLRSLTADRPTDPAVRRNLLRAALELAVRRLPAAAALQLLLERSALDDLSEDLRSPIGRQLLRLSLMRRRTATPLLPLSPILRGEGPGVRGEPSDAMPPHPRPLSPETGERGERKQPLSSAGKAQGDEPPDDAILAAAERLSPGDGLAVLMRAWLRPDAAPPPAATDAPAVVRLWQAARALADGNPVEESWREEVRGLRALGRLKAPAQALLLLEAARRGDAAAVSALLDETDPWRGFRPAPPRFVTEAVVAVVAGQPNHPGWRRSLGRWVQVWGADALGSPGATLAALAGLSPPSAGAAEPPPGTPPAPWFLHRAARALGRDDAEALAYVRRALQADPDLAADAVRAALPELERRAAARALAEAVRPDAAVPVTPAPLLVDAVDLIAALPDGPDLLDAAVHGDLLDVRSGLHALAERPDLPPRLAHHLALLNQHAAEALEDADRGEDAKPYWRGAWRLWLRFLANPEFPAGADAAQARSVLLDWLLAGCRRRVADLLARNAVDAARRHWALVRDLPETAGEIDASLGADLAGRAARFRDDLATDYLLATREAMRYGDIPEGWRADYAKGLSVLPRLLSLDRDNVRLLTAMVEICDEWFLDLYNAGDPRRLAEHVERFTPFASQLARLSEDRPGDLAARAALSDFYKFRGFVAGERARKIELYREALRFNPGNDNVRGLLADLGAPADDGDKGVPNEPV